MKTLRFTFFCILSFVLLAVLARAEGLLVPLKVYYLEFPPYYYTDSKSEPAGFLLERADEILRKVGIEPTYESLPAKRVLQQMRVDTPQASIGWFRTVKRERFAKFSHAIYRNKPLQIMYLSKNDYKFEHARTLHDVVTDKEVELGVPAGYAYGEYIDILISINKPTKRLVPGGYGQLVRMLALERFDYMIIAPEEADELIRRNHLRADLFRLKSLGDIPDGNDRHLMFSKSVPDDVVNAVNKAIGELGGIE